MVRYVRDKNWGKDSKKCTHPMVAYKRIKQGLREDVICGLCHAFLYNREIPTVEPKKYMSRFGVKKKYRKIGWRSKKKK